MFPLPPTHRCILSSGSVEPQPDACCSRCEDGLEGLSNTGLLGTKRRRKNSDTLQTDVVIIFPVVDHFSEQEAEALQAQTHSTEATSYFFFAPLPKCVAVFLSQPPLFFSICFHHPLRVLSRGRLVKLISAYGCTVVATL